MVDLLSFSSFDNIYFIKKEDLHSHYGCRVKRDLYIFMIVSKMRKNAVCIELEKLVES